MVGLRRGTATLVGEARWTTAQMPASIVRDLDTFKVPALKQAGFKIASELRIVLWSKSGYSSSLVELARQDQRITLVDVEAVLGQGRTTQA